MNKLSAYAFALAVCIGTTAAALVNQSTAMHQPDSDAQLALDGAYQDGLYLGRLTAERGQPLSPPIGRWSSDEDRASFAAGYQRGYNDVLSRKATTTRNAEE